MEEHKDIEEYKDMDSYVQKKSGQSRIKRMIALSGAILLLAIYVILLILAFADFVGWESYFLACMASTIAVPIIVWINIYLFERIIGKNEKKNIDKLQ